MDHSGWAKLAWKCQGNFPGELRRPGGADILWQSWKSVDSGAWMNAQVELHQCYFPETAPKDAI